MSSAVPLERTARRHLTHYNWHRKSLQEMVKEDSHNTAWPNALSTKGEVEAMRACIHVRAKCFDLPHIYSNCPNCDTSTKIEQRT